MQPGHLSTAEHASFISSTPGLSRAVFQYFLEGAEMLAAEEMCSAAEAVHHVWNVVSGSKPKETYLHMRLGAS